MLHERETTTTTTPVLRRRRELVILQTCEYTRRSVSRVHRRELRTQVLYDSFEVGRHDDYSQPWCVPTSRRVSYCALTQFKDTGSSDLWVMSEACRTEVCQSSTAAPYKSSTQVSSGADVDLRYGDSTTGSHARGPVVMDQVTVAGLSMGSQIFAAVNDTNNVAISNGGSGIFGLGFPSQRCAVCGLCLESNSPGGKFHRSGCCEREGRLRAYASWSPY